MGTHTHMHTLAGCWHWTIDLWHSLQQSPFSFSVSCDKTHVQKALHTHTVTHYINPQERSCWQVGPSGFATRGQRHSIIMQPIFCFNRNSMVQNRGGNFYLTALGCVLSSGGFHLWEAGWAGGSERSVGCKANATIQQCIFNFSFIYAIWFYDYFFIHYRLKVLGHWLISPFISILTSFKK